MVRQRQVVDVYEVSNETLRESQLRSGTLAEGPGLPSHWDLRRHKVTRRLVEPALPPRAAAVFLDWYIRLRREMGWKVFKKA